MSSCLGLYIENDIIKYAKVSKEHDNFKIESFGIKFYDNIDEAVKQIVNETYSYKTAISTNLSNEKYTYSELFKLLNSKDLTKAVKTEFEYFCNQTNRNFNALEYRNLLIPNISDEDKITSMYVYTEKADIAQKLQVLSGLRVNDISPSSVAIANLLHGTNKSNKVILNIENKTTVTFVVNGTVHRVETIDTGMKEIFENIIAKENSYAKAYEICKNTTIYTMQGRNLQIEENEYMEDIMPVLYKIVENLNVFIGASAIQIDEIYITGLAASINNIDLYFQENFPDKKCEILVPFFVDKANIKLNIRDYIEVNSAIGLALQGIGLGPKEINFKNRGTFEQISGKLSKEGGSSSKNSNKEKRTSGLKGKFNFDVKSPLDKVEMGMIRLALGTLILLIVYVIFSNMIINQINKKEKEVQEFIYNSNARIAEISSKTRAVDERTSQYDSMIAKIDELNNKLTESYARKNAVPNFLTEIMFNIPKNVQLLSIQNPSEKLIRIEAQATEYEQLGYFIAKIKNEGILTDVTATSGVKELKYIVTTIEGNLPY